MCDRQNRRPTIAFYSELPTIPHRAQQHNSTTIPTQKANRTTAPSGRIIIVLCTVYTGSTPNSTHCRTISTNEWLANTQPAHSQNSPSTSTSTKELFLFLTHIAVMKHSATAFSFSWDLPVLFVSRWIFVSCGTAERVFPKIIIRRCASGTITASTVAFVFN